AVSEKGFYNPRIIPGLVETLKVRENAVSTEMRRPHEGCRPECIWITACDRDRPRPAAWHRRGHCRRRGEPCAGLRQRGAQRGAKILAGTARGARSEEHTSELQ